MRTEGRATDQVIQSQDRSEDFLIIHHLVQSALLMEPPANRSSCTSVAVSSLGAEPCMLCCPSVSTYICPEQSRFKSAKFSDALAELYLIPLLGQYFLDIS